jgi:hypothetical protein
LKQEHSYKAGTVAVALPRTAPTRLKDKAQAKEHLRALGHDEATVSGVITAATSGRKRGRSETRRISDIRSRGASAASGMDIDDEITSDEPRSKRARSVSRTAALTSKFGADAVDAVRGRVRDASVSRASRRSVSNNRSAGIKTDAIAKKITKEARREQRAKFYGMQGQTDRAIPAKRPKHLFAGKSTIGSKDWR